MKTAVSEVKWAWDHPVVQELLLKYYRTRIFSTPEEADALVRQVLSLAGTEPPGAVLDVGCGLGYHAAAFAKRGFKVFAFDPGDQFVAHARQYALECKVDVEVARMHCRDLEHATRFSMAWAGAYCPGQLTPDEVEADFRRIWRALMPEGIFVSSVAGKSKAPPSEKAKSWSELEDCYVLTEKWSDGTHAHEHCAFVYPDSNRVVKVHEVDRMYGSKEIVPLLEQAGFVDITTYRQIGANEPAGPGGYFAFRCAKQGGSSK